MIVGTAGHIDHGKTTLVRALTGVDTDRLPEEKQRGISIELGYAFLDVPGQDERIGFIDVPGHERLVHTMLAGATGIDFGLLLVAADDGVMPQTREHLAVLSLLGLARGAVAVTKTDRVEPARVQAVCAEAAALLEGTPLAGAPVLPVSAVQGQGLAALHTLLADEAARHARVRPGGAEQARGFRLAVDRAFTLAGVGTVVTGTVHAGRVAVGDELLLTPSDTALRGRVRSLHAQNQAVSEAGAGQRCAVNLAGVGRDAVARGRWLVSADVAASTTRFDASLTLWKGEARALRAGTPVHVHVGTADALGTVAMLSVGHESLAPGATALVQIVLRQRLAVWHGDRVVLRDAGASRTLAGGEVLDPDAPMRYRRTPERLAALQAWQLPTPRERLLGLLAAAPHGVDLGRWARAEGLSGAAGERLLDESTAPLPDPAPADGPPASLAFDGAAPHLPAGGLRVREGSSSWCLGASQADALRRMTLEALAAYHARQPEEVGPDAARLRRLVAPRLHETLWRAALAGLRDDGLVGMRASFVHLPAHAVRLSASEERLLQKLAGRLQACDGEGLWARDLARDARESEPLVRSALARLAQRGELHQVVRDLYYPPAAIETLASLARAVASDAHGEVTAAAFRDRTGLGRKRAIQVLEYFDRVGLLRRIGDVHRLRSDTALFEAAR